MYSPPLYNSYASYFKGKYGSRLQKLAIDAGFSCPNRSADRREGGCVFCNNSAFNPSYCSPEKSITRQIEEGIEFHSRRYRNAAGYLAYFQPYSNTFSDIDTLRRLYGEAIAHPQVKGLIIGTRPDCVDEEKLEYIASLSEGGRRFVAIEYGIESCYDTTLQLLQRGHGFDATRRAVEMTSRYGIHCGGHLILGLPGESREMMLNEIQIINSLPLDTVKFHQLQIIKGTPLAESLERITDNGGQSPFAMFRPFALDEYISLVCDILERLRPDIMVERFAGEVPPRFQAFPQYSWCRADGKLIRNEEIAPMVIAELRRRGSRQGYRYVALNNL